MPTSPVKARPWLTCKACPDRIPPPALLTMPPGGGGKAEEKEAPLPPAPPNKQAPVTKSIHVGACTSAHLAEHRYLSDRHMSRECACYLKTSLYFRAQNLQAMKSQILHVLQRCPLPPTLEALSVVPGCQEHTLSLATAAAIKPCLC